MTFSDKHSSLSRRGFNYDRKSFKVEAPAVFASSVKMFIFKRGREKFVIQCLYVLFMHFIITDELGRNIRNYLRTSYAKCMWGVPYLYGGRDILC